MMPLKPGDTIGVAASASSFDRPLFEAGLKALRQLGFEVYYRRDIFAKDRYLAGSDQRRAEELMELFQTPQVKAILFARGGYGSQRIIRLLDPKIIRRHSKPVVGFSDLTALLTYLRQECLVPTFYGPVITRLGKASKLTLEQLFLALTKATWQVPPAAQSAKVLKPGQAEGKLVGGCLALINSSLKTIYELKTNNCLLFLEDAGEKTYVLDRMLTQLKNAGKLSRVRGIIFGSLSSPPEGDLAGVEAMLNDLFADFSGPVITRFPAGHAEDFVTLPLGVVFKLKASEKGIKYL